MAFREVGEMEKDLSTPRSWVRHLHALNERLARVGSRVRLGRTERDEAGAVLVLALLFLGSVGLVVGALASWTTNDLNNTAHFASARSLQFAASSATETAIQNIRYTPLLLTTQTLNASPPSACWGTSPSTPSTVTSNGSTMAVWCSTVWTPTSANTRVVTFSTCVSTMSASACALTPYLQAVVTFDDYPSGVVSAPSGAQCVAYCGTGITVNSWLFSPTVPTVTAISTSGGGAGGSITGGTTVTITGSGFVSGASTVNFVEESGGAPASDNTVLPASNVVFNSSTSLTAVSPEVIEGTTYFVTVTTPTGTSAYTYNGTGQIFTYSLIAPTVTGISPTSGLSAGGTSISITGTGFVTGATVSFVEESGGSLASPNVILGATSVSVVSDSAMTAVSPAIIAGSTYYVTVRTPTGTSSYGPAVFTYSTLVPVVSSISVTAGPSAGGTSLTITGTGFYTGATVTFVEESGGSAVSPTVSVPATGVVLNGATTITAVSPAVTVGSTYFVTVTTTGGTSSGGPVFTYS